jgi:Transport and Golgi organisation 2
MCTVSWVHQPSGYHLLFNRDEKRTRGTAFAPALIERGGVRFIAPIDADFGGTWLAANEFGISLCLLNGDAATASSGAPPRRRSRGLLLRELAWASSGCECVLWLKQLDLGPFAPFVLLVLEPDRSATLAEWDGEHLTIDPAGDSHMPLTSSSYHAPEVRRFRQSEFARHVDARPIGPDTLYRFHTSHGASPDAYSPCMHRADAVTVSFSWVIVTREEIRFLYSPSAPCRHSRTEQQILTRAA